MGTSCKYSDSLATISVGQGSIRTNGTGTIDGFVHRGLIEVRVGRSHSTDTDRNTRWGIAVTACLTCALVGLFAPRVEAQDLEACRALYRSGKYAEAMEMAKQAVDNRAFGHDWRIILGESMLALGRYDDAALKMGSLLQRYPTSVRMLMLAHDVYLMNGQTEEAKRMLSRIDQLARSFGAEFWERFCYYGMRAVLAPYVAMQFFSHLSGAEAEEQAREQRGVAGAQRRIAGAQQHAAKEQLLADRR